MSFIPGMRCRSARTIVFAGGIVRRTALGTLVSQRENLGRTLFTVDFDRSTSPRRTVDVTHGPLASRDNLSPSADADARS